MINRSSKQDLSHPQDDSFDQLIIKYIRQVGNCYESDKAIQQAVKNLEKTIKKTR
ncbi:hypothetical protein [Spirosoma koreense]